MKDEDGNIPHDPAAVHVAISIASQEMRPMMDQGDQKMSESEKLIHNFVVAVTLVHEIAHAYYHIYCPSVQKHPDTEDMMDAQGVEVPVIDEVCQANLRHMFPCSNLLL